LLNTHERLKSFVIRAGRTKATLAITAIACVTAVLLFTSIMLWLNPSLDALPLASIAVVVTALIALPITWIYLDLMFPGADKHQRLNAKFKHFVLRMGRKNSTFLITLISFIMALIISTPLIYILAIPIDFVEIIVIVGLTALLITPPIAWPVLGVIFDLAQTQQALQHTINHDHLTGLLSRKRFFEQAGILCEKDAQSSVISIDIDHFKSINDLYGHAYGDQVLIHFAKVLNQVNLNTQHAIGRLGGEEFAIYLSQSNEPVAMSFALLIQQTLASMPTAGEPQGYIRVSMGISCQDASHKSLDQLLLESDQALYLAKTSGRNMIKCFSEVANA